MDYKKALEVARKVATKAHEGQADKVGMPYIQHPMAVCELVDGEQEKIVALLHDVVEDTGVTLNDLRNHGFDDEIIAAVEAITKRKGEEFEKYLQRVKANEIALAVKFADIQHNMSPDRYEKLPPETKERLVAKYNHALAYLRGNSV